MSGECREIHTLSIESYYVDVLVEKIPQLEHDQSTTMNLVLHHQFYIQCANCSQQFNDLVQALIHRTEHLRSVSTQYETPEQLLNAPLAIEEIVHESSTEPEAPADQIQEFKIDDSCGIDKLDDKETTTMIEEVISPSDTSKSKPTSVRQSTRRGATRQMSAARLPGNMELTVCEVCKRQVKRSTYNAHLAVHRKRHQCSQCGKAYTWPSELTEHKNAVHNDERLLCPHCMRTFFSKVKS